jgi:hypothetical protein
MRYKIISQDVGAPYVSEKRYNAVKTWKVLYIPNAPMKVINLLHTSVYAWLKALDISHLSLLLPT